MKKTSRTYLAGALVAAALLVVVAPAGAQPRENPLERARHYMELGQEAFKEGRFADAAEQFLGAYSASPFAAFLYNAAMAYEKGKDSENAVKFYQRYLQVEPDAHDYAQVDMKIRALLAGGEEEPAEGEEGGEEASPEVEISEVEMKSLISVRTNPNDATVRVIDTNGVEVSRAQGPSAQTVVRGTYTVEASHPDFRTVQTNITVVPGQVYIVVVEMSQGAFLGFLHVTTDVPGAAVYIDDKAAGQVGTTPWGNVLPAGKHTIWVEKPGYVTVEKEVEVNMGEELELPVELERPDYGTLLVKTNLPGSQVLLDGKPLGLAPLEEQVAPGRHKLEVMAEEMKTYTAEVVVEQGQRTKVLVRMNPTPSRTSAWVSAGFAVALFAGGGVAGYFALDLDRQLDKDRKAGTLASDDSRILEGFLWALGADIAFGIGTIVGALSIYYFVRDPLPPSEGKLFDPVDFDAAPEAVAEGDGKPPAGPAEGSGSESTDAALLRRDEGPRLRFAPYLDTQAAGFGLAVVF